MKESQTILKKDGRVDYLPRFLSSKESEGYFNLLKEEINWKKDELIMFSKRIVMRRESAWFADEERPYKYAGINRKGETWTPHLSELKNRVEDFWAFSLTPALLITISMAMTVWVSTRMTKRCSIPKNQSFPLALVPKEFFSFSIKRPKP